MCVIFPTVQPLHPWPSYNIASGGQEWRQTIYTSRRDSAREFTIRSQPLFIWLTIPTPASPVSQAPSCKTPYALPTKSDLVQGPGAPSVAFLFWTKKGRSPGYFQWWDGSSSFLLWLRWGLYFLSLGILFMIMQCIQGIRRRELIGTKQKCNLYVYPSICYFSL